MKFSRVSPEFDATDRAILELLQENCKQPLAAIGDKVGLKAPSVVERIRKLEEAGAITGYVALLDARRLGNDITVFIGVDSERPRSLGRWLTSTEHTDPPWPISWSPTSAWSSTRSPRRVAAACRASNDSRAAPAPRFLPK